MFGPLNFNIQSSYATSVERAPCPLCGDTFNLNLALDVFLKHLFSVHEVVIEDVQNIPKLLHYLEYWQRKFQTHALSSIVPSIDIELPLLDDDSNTPITMAKKKYYLISTLMKEDRELRQRLRLEHALERQEFERSDSTFEHACLFCRLEHVGTRRAFLEHLADAHNLQLGSAANLVFVDELLATIQSRLDAFTCIYCEKTFPDRVVLKEHMRKKIHKRINPTNRLYDRFFVVNYTGDAEEVDAAPVAIEPGVYNADAEYSDWTENAAIASINCLFCEHSDTDLARLCMHMQAGHKFNFPELAAHLDFYQRVKLVNFIRKRVHLAQCPTCDAEQGNAGDLLSHMKMERCFVLPNVEKFDQPEYYFPTYENDAFLYYLEEVED